MSGSESSGDSGSGSSRSGVGGSNKIIETSDSRFDHDVLQSHLPVLVDFWAPWCVPCKLIAPLLEEILEELGSKLKICKINVDDNPRSPSQYDVRGIPNLILFKNGAVVDRVVGFVPKDQLMSVLAKVL